MSTTGLQNEGESIYGHSRLPYPPAAEFRE